MAPRGTASAPAVVSAQAEALGSGVTPPDAQHVVSASSISLVAPAGTACTAACLRFVLSASEPSATTSISSGGRSSSESISHSRSSSPSSSSSPALSPFSPSARIALSFLA
eukprot:CAMPEP_0119194872 /NCGR_PEP_ID=MMETSP1316-20130426/4499_1 /TAXON_ID=41880 /ORGANISM="Pycnococcus provasolii, Strain RCC2336" /LENGTH=110 /DNA_ID=CAMNT_0007190229 /DNA_START=40 /DNA_END=368 /DNA_ORIENTATION=+